MKHEYVDASDLIQTDMRSGNEKKLDAMLDERGANEMGAETAVVLRNIALELMAQLEQDEKTRPASDADMAVYRGIAANYHKDKADLTQQDAQAVQQGYKLVPVEALSDHIADLRRCASMFRRRGMTATADETIKAADELEAMLNAAPTPPAQEKQS